MPPVLIVYLLIILPTLGILLIGYKWLDDKAQRRPLAPSAEEMKERFQSLHERIEDLEQERDALRDRIQNLETIVTSEAWIADHDDLSELGELTLPPDRDSDSAREAKHSAEIARRLRGE